MSTSDAKKGGVSGQGSSGGSALQHDDNTATSPTGLDDDEESMDWWTKYFASVDAMIEVRNSLFYIFNVS